MPIFVLTGLRVGACLMRPCERVVNGAGSVVALGAAAVAFFTPAESSMHWDAILIGVAAIVTAATPALIVWVRVYEANRKAEREQRERDRDRTEAEERRHAAVLGELEASRAKLAWLDAQVRDGYHHRAERERRIAELERELAATRINQNQVRAAVRPPLPPLPPGPIEKRLSDSGEYPPYAGGEATD